MVCFTSVPGQAFEDAVALWHMADLSDSSGRATALQRQGEVEIGAELGEAEHEASSVRGGNALVAVLGPTNLDLVARGMV